jgi:signal peptidase II
MESSAPPAAPPVLPRAALLAIFAGSAALAAGLDLWTKSTAQSRLAAPAGGRQIEVVEGSLGFRYVENKGIIFGAFKSLSTAFFVIAVVAVPVIVVIFVRLKAPTLTMTLALSFVLGGTLGNLHDRIFHGAVRDFIYFYLIDWPIFNLADSYILVGTILLMLELTLLDEKKPKPEAASA